MWGKQAQRRRQILYYWLRVCCQLHWKGVRLH
jgi:hypothetical protein